MSFYTGSGGSSNSGGSSGGSSGGGSSCNSGGSAGGAGSSSYIGGVGVGSGGATGAANVPLPNGSTITIPYTSNGWYYTIPIPPSKSPETKVKPKDGRDGCDCVKCKSFFEFAEPNQEDGTLICWACRHGY